METQSLVHGGGQGLGAVIATCLNLNMHNKQAHHMCHKVSIHSRRLVHALQQLGQHRDAEACRQAQAVQHSQSLDSRGMSILSKQAS